MKNYIQEGDVIQFTSGANLTSGQVVVIGQVLGVSTADFTSGATALARIEGVFRVPKVSGAVIAAGESLTWDVSAGAFDDNAATAATGDVTGGCAIAFESAGNGATEINVKFTGVPGTVKA